MTDPIGIRNNNPGNIRASGLDWEGAVGEEGGFVKFDGPIAGGKALIKNLMAYNSKYGLDTVEGIIGRWAPATENNTAAYVTAVSAGLGVGPKDPLDMRSPVVLAKLASLIARHENGGDHFGSEFFGKVAESAVQGVPVDPLTRAYVSTAKAPAFTKAVARAEALGEFAQVDLAVAADTRAFNERFPASLDGPPMYEADVQRLAKEQYGVSFTESVLDSLVHNTVTAKLVELMNRGEYDPQFDPMSEANKKRSIEAGIYGNDNLMDYVNAARNAQDFSERLTTAQERMDMYRRMGNMHGLSYASAVTGQLIGGVADPVALVTTMSLGASVAAVRSSAAAGRALAIAQGAGVAAVENIALGQVLEQADNQRFSWGTLFEQGITGAALGAVGGLLVDTRGRAQVDPAQTVSPEAVPVMTAAAKAVQDVVDSNLRRAWDDGQMSGNGRLGEAFVDHSYSTNFDDLTTHSIPTLGRARVNPLEEARARMLDRQIDALEAERAGHVAAAGGAAERGGVRSARQELDELRRQLPTAEERKALTRRYQDEGMKFKAAQARANKELDARQADIEAGMRRVQDGIDQNAKAEQAGQRLPELDKELTALRKERDGVAAPPTERTVLNRALESAFAVQRERGTLTPPARSGMPPQQAPSRSVHAELARLSQEAKDPLIRTLAARLGEQRFAGANIYHWAPEEIRAQTGGKGLAYYDRESGAVNLAHDAPDHVRIHEIAHAATADALALGEKYPNSTVGRIRTELDDLRREMRKLHGNSPEELTRYYLGSVEEFVAGLYSGDSDFVRRLASVKLGEGESLLSRAVQLVRTILGLGPQDTNAFLKALDLSDRLVNGDLPNQGGGKLLFPASDKLPLNAREQLLKDSLEAVGEELDPAAKVTAERGQRWLEKAPTWFDKGKTWAYSPGVALSGSKSRVARIAGSVLFENSLGSGKRNDTVAMIYDKLQQGYRDPYLMAVRADMVGLMSAKERADYSFLGGARKAVDRISGQVAEERARRRMAAKAGEQYVSQAVPEVQRIAKQMDDQIGQMVRDGLKAGNQYAESVQGSGITGFMPQVWKWDKFGDALRNDPRTWGALRKNFTEQYVEMNVDPVMRDMIAAGADADQVAAARARLMEQVEHQVNTRMGESVRDPDTRTSMDSGKFESMAAELLNENFQGVAVTDKVTAEFRRLLAEKMDDRSRTEFDLLREVDGVRLLDFVEHDVVSTIQHTAHRFAGQNAMAKAGFKDYADFEALLTLATKDGATPEEVQLLAFGGRAFGFMPMIAKDHPMLAALRNFTYAATMGKLGIANMADVAAVVTASGVRGMFKALGYGFRPSTELVQLLSKRGLSLVGQDYRIHAMTADVLPNGRAMTGMGVGMLRVSQKAAQLVSWVNGSNMLQRMLHKGFLPVMAEDLVNGIRGLDGGMSVRRMADAGLDGDTVARIRGQLEKYEPHRKEGDAFKWESWDDQQAADKLGIAMHRITYQVFQRALVGEAAMWRSESALGSVIGQFHNFGLTSMEKQLGRNLALNDMNTYTAMAVGMAWSSLLYYARLQAGTAGMSQADADEYMKKNLETGRLVTGTLTYFNMSGIAAELAGVGEVVFGGNTYQAGSGPVAAMGYLGNLSKAANSLGNLATGQEGTGKHVRNLLRILPGGNSLAGTYYSNVLKDWE